MRDMLDNICHLTDLKQTEWSINPVQYRGRAINYPIQTECLFFDYYDDLLQYSIDKYGVLNISSPIFLDSPCSCYCGAISKVNGYWVKPDNLLYACTDCSLNPLGAVVGNYVGFENDYHDRLKEIYSWSYHSERCRSCLSYIVCRGGCPARVINFGANSDYYNTQCKNQIKYWKSILTRVLSGEEVKGWKLVSTDDKNKKCLEYSKNRIEDNYDLIQLPHWIGSNVIDGTAYDIESGLVKNSRFLIKLNDGRVLYHMGRI